MNSATSFEEDPLQLRHRARECCHDADRSSDPIIRDISFALARAFEQLAMLAEAKGPCAQKNNRKTPASADATGAPIGAMRPATDARPLKPTGARRSPACPL